MAATSDPEAYLQEKEAARLINVSVRTLQAWRCQRRGPPFVRIGRSVRYQRRALLDWVKQENSAPEERQSDGANESEAEASSNTEQSQSSNPL